MKRMSNDEINRVIEDFLDGIIKEKENDSIAFHTYYGGVYTPSKGLKLSNKVRKLRFNTGMSSEESIRY